jgi:hypothetical protein
MPILSKMTEWFSDVCEIQCRVSELRNKNPCRSESHAAAQFMLVRIPAISIRLYVKRCIGNAKISEAAFIATLVYMSSFLRTTDSELNALLFYRLFGTSLVLAAKYCDDDYFSNAVYSKIVGVPTHEMNSMEIMLWKTLKYSCYIENETWQRFTEAKDCLDWQRMVFEMFQPLP